MHVNINIIVLGSIIFITAAVAIIFAYWLARFVLSKDMGSPSMQKVANSIFTGAIAYLNTQYATIGRLALVAAVAIALLLTFIGQTKPNFDLGWKTAVSFLLGAIASGISGYIGMYVAVRSNSRTASAATRSLGDALEVALRGGAVSAFLVVALSLLGVSSLFFLFAGGSSDLEQIPSLIVGFGFGASFVALFAQLGGGIYTKAADVGADLVGKVEAGIPEDDPRNPAVIADLVGDNVGDCAGRGADLFESTTAENIGAMILGASIYSTTRNVGWILFPLMVSGFGILSSVVGLLTIRASSVKNPAVGGGLKTDGGAIAQAQLNKGYAVTATLALISIFVLSYFLLNDTGGWYWFGLDGLVGIALSFTFVYITQYYTAGQYRPVREIAAACLTGPGTTIIQGLAVGFECTALPVIAISIALGAAYFFGTQATPTAAQSITYGIYGTAVATMGMLMSAAYILAMDTFGPITDNAGGITEMSNQPEEVRTITDALDGVGNTTKALTKGYAIGSAALAAFLLFSAYLNRLRVIDPVFKANAHIDLSDIRVFIAALLGAMLIFLFSSLAIRAVGTTAKLMIEEVRRQFRANPKIMLGEADPDYASCVSISTQGALRAMVLPGVLAVGMPVAVGVLLGPQAGAAFLMVGTITGILMALVMNNGGGAWDNAKKYIELGYLKDENGVVQGKKSPAHAASVVGDTVGDPFKDTAGPSLHVLIKLLSTITLVLAPIFILLQK